MVHIVSLFSLLLFVITCNRNIIHRSVTHYLACRSSYTNRSRRVCFLLIHKFMTSAGQQLALCAALTFEHLKTNSRRRKRRKKRKNVSWNGWVDWMFRWRRKMSPFTNAAPLASSQLSLLIWFVSHHHYYRINIYIEGESHLKNKVDLTKFSKTMAK